LEFYLELKSVTGWDRIHVAAEVGTNHQTHLIANLESCPKVTQAWITHEGKAMILGRPRGVPPVRIDRVGAIVVFSQPVQVALR